MLKYPKINGVFKRDQKTNKFIMWDYACPEFLLLCNHMWVWFEKIDGMNMRISAEETEDGPKLKVAGRTNAAVIPPALNERIHSLFDPAKLLHYFDNKPFTIYGEGYGPGIQKGGKYSDKQDFICFDINLAGIWQPRLAVEDFCTCMNIPIVPCSGVLKLNEAIEHIKMKPIHSQIIKPESLAEGVVGIPAGGFLNSKGERIITKLKNVDFAHMRGDKLWLS